MGKSPPESGGDPSRSEGGAVCSKFARSAFHMNFREAILVLIGALREYPTRNALRANFEQIFRLRPVGLALRPPGLAA